MPEDYRVTVGWSEHPKRWRMYDALGADATIAIWDLWEWVTQNRPDGNLHGMTPCEIARAAKLRNTDPKRWVAMLAKPFKRGGCGLLDGAPGEYVVHDWDQRNPYVAGHQERSERARAAARSRWHRRDAGGMPGALLPASSSNAPSGSVSGSDPVSGSVSPPQQPAHAGLRKQPKPVMTEETRAKLGALVDNIAKAKGSR